jgi:DNA-binding transcriptional LysR family regulator
MLAAAVEGMGLAQVPEPIAAEPIREGKLVQVLEPFAPMTPGMFVYYPSRWQMMPKLRAFIDHVKSVPEEVHKTRIRVDDGRTKPRQAS